MAEHGTSAATRIGTRPDPLFEFLLRMGDNTLILGHRVSEWCGHAPVLEEDIALANTALDRVADLAGRHVPRQIEMGDLAQGMNAGIRSAGDVQAYAAVVQQRLAEVGVAGAEGDRLQALAVRALQETAYMVLAHDLG